MKYNLRVHAENNTSKLIEVKGYLFEKGLLKFIIHRPVQSENVFANKYWSISEYYTGLLLGTSWFNTRQQAIDYIDDWFTRENFDQQLITMNNNIEYYLKHYGYANGEER